MLATSRLILSALILIILTTPSLADVHNYGDWRATVPPDPTFDKVHQTGVVEFALKIETEELKNGHPSGEMFSKWAFVCRKKPGTPWVLRLVVPYGVEGSTLSVNFDNSEELTVGMSDGEVAHSELITILKSMVRGNVMSYRKNGELRTISLQGLTAALRNHIQVCSAPITNKLNVALFGEGESELTAKVPPANTVATVNGVAISNSVLELYVESRTQKSADQASQTELDTSLQELKDIYLLTTQPAANDLSKDAQFKAQVELQKLATIAQAVAQDFISRNQATDEEILGKYEELFLRQASPSNPVPLLEEVRGEIKQRVEQDKLQQYIGKLRAETKAQ